MGIRVFVGGCNSTATLYVVVVGFGVMMNEMMMMMAVGRKVWIFSKKTMNIP
jgi:hypothetical protein